MRNIHTSLIAGVLLVEMVFGAFLLSHKSHRSTVEPDVATNSSAESVAAAPQSGDPHVTAGSVVGAVPLSGGTAAAVTGARQSTSGAVVMASIAPMPAPARGVAAGAAQAPRLDTRLDTRLREPVAVHGYVVSKINPGPVERTDSRRDSLRRHGSNPVASAITDELVKKSAQLDPALPPPSPSPSAQPVRDDPYRPGSNPVAAAMTDQLVRESAKLDPALPPPEPDAPDVK